MNDLERALTIRREGSKTSLKMQAGVATTLASLGNCYSFMKEYSKAEEALTEAVEKRKTLSGPEHITTASCYQALGNYLRIQGKVVEAESYLTRSLSIRTKLLGPYHPHRHLLLGMLWVISIWGQQLGKKLVIASNEH